MTAGKENADYPKDVIADIARTNAELMVELTDLQAENSELRGLLSAAQMHLSSYVISEKDYAKIEKSVAFIMDIKRVLGGDGE